MWQWFIELLRHHPEMALILTLGFGYWIGKLRLGSVSLGAVVGVLIAGAVIGQIGVQPSADLKTTFFLLFLFAIGYRTGPQFFSGLRSSGLPQIVLTVIYCVTALALAYLFTRLLRYDPGTAGGLLAGSTTESAAVGTATDAINRLPLGAAEKQSFISNVAVAFAVTYFLGVITTVTLLSRFGPRLLGVNLADECAKLEKQMGFMSEQALPTGYQEFTVRALRVEDASCAGKTVREIERAAAARGLVPRHHPASEVPFCRPDRPAGPAV